MIAFTTPSTDCETQKDKFSLGETKLLYRWDRGLGVSGGRPRRSTKTTYLSLSKTHATLNASGL